MLVDRTYEISMTEIHQQLRAAFLSTLMILSVVAGTAFIGGAAAAGSADTVDTNASASLQNSVGVQEGSFKPMTLSWFREEGNGPYPVPPNEYGGSNAPPGMGVFANAKGDDDIAIDNSTARNPNGYWDMVVLNIEVEASTLEQLDPPTQRDGADQPGLVTQSFIDNGDWSLDFSQVNGDKTLDVAANQEGYDAPDQLEAETSYDIPPVMVFADTTEMMTDYMVDGDPETSLYVWIDPNRAMLEGGSGQFETGESYNAQINIGDYSESVTIDMAEGDTTFDMQNAPNTGQAEITGQSALAVNTDVEMVVEHENGTVIGTKQTTVGASLPDGNQYLSSAENPGSMPRAPVSATFNLAGMSGSNINVEVNGAHTRELDAFNHTSGSTTLPVGDVIVEDYTIENTSLVDSKPLTIAYTNPDHTTAVDISTQVGDGHLSGDGTIAKNINVDDPYFDEMFLHYETGAEIFPAIEKSPGANAVEQFINSPLSLDVTQTNADGAPKTLDLSQNDSGVFVVPDNGSGDPRIYNKTDSTGLFFSFKLNDMVFFQDGEKVEPEVGDEFEATLSVETSERGTLTETINFEIVEGKTVLATDQLALTQSESAEVIFNSTMARGTAMGIQLVSEDGTINESTGEMTLNGLGPQICCDGPNTAPWGTISATFDTSDVPQGTDITATARIVADLPDSYPEPLTVATAEGQIVAPPSGNLSVSAQSGDGSSVTIDSVGLSDGGFIAVRNPSGATLGSSSYLEAGTHSDVTVELDQAVSEDATLSIVAHTDSNDNKEFEFPIADDPYPTESGGELSATLDYTVEGGDQTTSGGETTTEEDTETTESEDTTTTEASGSGGTPGFGIGAALVALLAAGFLLFRRD